jgi:hypothetical protein
MAASEYGSYYWCVLLNGESANSDGQTIHLHADQVAIDSNGALTFRSAGRRPAGAEPNQQDDKSEEDYKSKAKSDGKEGSEKTEMIYVAFAPGSWKVMFAAKLRDGSPASIEHWSEADGSPRNGGIPASAGAAGFNARE